MKARLLLLALLFVGAPAAFGAICTSTVATTGNWGTAGSWNCGRVPLATDDVVIAVGDTITVDIANAVAQSVTFNNGAGNSGLTIATGNTLTVSQGVTFTTSTSNSRTRTLAVQSGAKLIVGGNLTMNTGAVTGTAFGITIASNASSLVQIGGSISFSGTVAPSIAFAGAGTLSVAGDFPSGIAFTQGTGTVMYNGGGAQVMGAYTYSNLTVSKSGGTATAAGNVTATSLTFAAGNAGLISVPSANVLTVTGSCPGAVTRTGNGHVIGNLRLTFTAGGNCTFPLGDATNYTPLTVDLTGGSAGTLTAGVATGAPANLSISPLSSSKYVARSFTLGASGDTATATSYNATLNWVAGDVQGGASFSNFVVAQYQGGWLVPGPTASGNAATSIVAQTTSTAFTTPSVFAIGEAFACLPPTGAPAGAICQCDRFGRATLNPSTIYNGNWPLSTSSGSFGIPKIVNQGYLRLTDNTGNNSSSATVPGIFPAAGNWVSVEFQNFAYNGSGADGIAVTLSDYSVAPTPGAFGGSLGYAQKTGINGFAGGWVGVALDEYGNYENNTEGRSGGASGALYPDSIGVRGSGSGTTGYNWLTGALNLGNIDNAGSATASNGYMYQVVVDARTYTGPVKSALVSVNRDTTGTGNSYATVVPPFDAYVVNPTQAAVPVNWQISFTGSTGGSTNIHEIGSLKVCAQSFLPPTASTTAADFNAIDSALPNTKQNALFGHIYMKVANVPFKLNVAALLPQVGGVSQGVNTVYASSGNKTVTVKLIDDSQAGASCNSTDAACTACAKPVVATQTMTFTGADGGFKTSADFTVNGGYKRLIAQMSEGTTIGCSTDAFSVRPATYLLTSNNTSPTKAGSQFTITATPKNPSNATITATPGTPVLDNTLAPAVGGVQTLLMQSWNTGATFGTFIYNDVGNFNLPVNAIYDTQYGNAAGEAQDRTNGDCNPGSGTPYSPNVCYGYAGTCTNTSPWAADSSGKYGCDIGSQPLTGVGRFYPDHYEASLGATHACSADGFSYMGQPFSMTGASSSGSMQIKALAAGQTFAGAPGLPSYTGTYTPRANAWFGAQNGIGSTTDLARCISSTQNTSANRCITTTLPYKGAASNAWTAGVFTMAPTTYYFDPPKDTATTPDSTWGPYDQLYVGVTVSDSDLSTLTIPSGQSFVLNGDTYQNVFGSLTMAMRYGRMRLQNTSGSGQVPLLMPVLLEYWSGATNGWRPNTLDVTCTRLANPPPVTFGGNSAAAACYGAGCTSTTTGPMGSIYTAQKKTVPANAGIPSYSAATFSYGQRNVMLAAPKASGTLGISIEAPTWLKIGPVDPAGANPSATVHYGTYNSRFIFLRENY